jgi:hypothetical protein
MQQLPAGLVDEKVRNAIEIGQALEEVVTWPVLIDMNLDMHKAEAAQVQQLGMAADEAFQTMAPDASVAAQFDQDIFLVEDSALKRGANIGDRFALRIKEGRERLHGN